MGGRPTPKVSSVIVISGNLTLLSVWFEDNCSGLISAGTFWLEKIIASAIRRGMIETDVERKFEIVLGAINMVDMIFHPSF